jgi:hypothetical protein
MLKSIIMIGIILKVASILTFHILYSLYLDYVRLYNLYVYKIVERKNSDKKQALSIKYTSVCISSHDPLR